MSRKTTTKAVLVASAVAATSLLAGTASAATPTVTKVGPATAATTGATTVVVTGTSFDSSVKGLSFQVAAETQCVASAVVVVSPTTLFATKPSTCGTAGLQKVKLWDTLAATGTQLGSDFAPTEAKKTITFAAPTTISSVAPTSGSSFGGTTVTVTVGSTSSTTPLKATLGGRPLAGIKVVDATHFTAKTPSGTPGAADLVVTTNGVDTAANSSWAYKLALKVTPNVYDSSAAAAPYVKIEGIGFKPASTAKQYVSFCGVQAPVLSAAVTGTKVKAPTDTELWVQAPSFAAASAGTADGKVSGGSGVNGGLCVVKVVVDPNGTDVLTTATTDLSAAAPTSPADATADTDVTSVVTATSGFVYAAY